MAWGLTPWEQALPDHFGILGMGERASILGGRLDVESRPEHGTLIRAVVPVRRSSTGNIEERNPRTSPKILYPRILERVTMKQAMVRKAR
jgi:hypothetical protein